MSLLQDIMKKYVNLDYKKLVAYAKLSAYIIYPACRTADGEDKCCSTIASIVLSALNSDGKITDKEKKFISDVFDADENAVEFFLNEYTDETKEKAKRFSKQLSDELKIEVARLVLCIGCADLTITKEEALLMTELI